MGLTKVIYVDGETKITAKNLNDIQDEVIKKLDKVTAATQYNQAYIKQANGNQVMYNVGHYNNPSAIPQYAYASASVGVADNGGTFAVAMPQQPYQPTPKKYVDERLHRYKIYIELDTGTLDFSILSSKKSEEITFADIEAYMTGGYIPAMFSDTEGRIYTVYIWLVYYELEGMEEIGYYIDKGEGLEEAVGYVSSMLVDNSITI